MVNPATGEVVSYYANIPYLEEKFVELVAEKPDVRWIVMDCRGVNAIDVTAVEGLEALVSGYRSRGVGILLTDVKLLVRERLASAGRSEKFGSWTLRSTTSDAVVYARSARGDVPETSGPDGPGRRAGA